MKSISTLCLSFSLFVSTLAHADGLAAAPPEKPVRDTVLTVSFSPQDWGDVSLEASRVMSPGLALGVELLAGLNRSDTTLDVLAVDGYLHGGDDTYGSYMLGVGARARFFLAGTAPEGPWLSPGLAVSRAWRSFTYDSNGLHNETRERQWGASADLLVGYTAIVGNGLVVQLGVGGEAHHGWSRLASRSTGIGEESPTGSSTRARKWTLNERLELSVGWAL
ncbi:hypothetical protein LY474_13570 [Myxococcus stipitatus]|uniref:hypothetical protein n=1 Tax=Myxococcus stipitatus TaxID=83455 RepID=UPI001F2546D9|nr:hypothetical protein [Myxococcus stipitatus]MCE9668848.1 hypothetical protein [Myxococcus stipitatus]